LAGRIALFLLPKTLVIVLRRSIGKRLSRISRLSRPLEPSYEVYGVGTGDGLALRMNGKGQGESVFC
jgi:hypothetical protein